MAKYDPLKRYLKRQSVDRLELSFWEIERMLNALLPRGAAQPEWWANDAVDIPTHVQIAAWRDAGYTASLLPGERVLFERARPRP
jgi:hypothetical protein